MVRGTDAIDAFIGTHDDEQLVDTRAGADTRLPDDFERSRNEIGFNGGDSHGTSLRGCES
jgi:hypothetical protein